MINSSYSTKPRNFSYLIWSFLCIALIIPVELYLGGVFLRPILLGTLVIWMILVAASLNSSNPIKIYSLNTNYLLYMTFLAVFFIFQTSFHGRFLVGFKETIEIIGSLALMLLLVKVSVEIGIIRSFFILRNIAFIGAIAFVASKFLSGNFITFKDPYWIILIASLLSIISLKIRANKLDWLIVFILIIFAALSASRTLWATSIVFVFILFGALRFILPALIFSASLIIVSSFDDQYSYYFDTFFFIFNNYLDIISDVQIVADNLDNKSDQVRIIESLRAVSVFLEHPFIGVGLDNYQDYITMSQNYDVDGYLTPHNEFLRVLAEGGIILFCIYGFLYKSIWNDISKIINEDIKAIAKGLVFASLTLAFFTATNYTFHFILQLSLMSIASYDRANKSFVNRN